MQVCHLGNAQHNTRLSNNYVNQRFCARSQPKKGRTKRRRPLQFLDPRLAPPALQRPLGKFYPRATSRRLCCFLLCSRLPGDPYHSPQIQYLAYIDNEDSPFKMAGLFGVIHSIPFVIQYSTVKHFYLICNMYKNIPNI